jgi:foldase protein PrsA
MDSELNVEVKIIELLTDDLDIVKLVLDELENGSDFKELAVKYTIREEAKNNNGELGYFNINEFGEIGVKAAQMQIGEMYGPIKVPEGYSLFELVDRKEMTELPTDNYEIEREQIKIELKNKKYYNMMINKTVELANKYDIKIDEQVLSLTKVLNTTTVIYRIFGFGGKLLAVPMTFPNYNWYKQWLQQTEVTP